MQKLMGLHMPEEYGGSGASKTATAIVLEEVAKVDSGVSGMIQVRLVTVVFSL